MNVGKYYVAGIPFDSENSLKHYGVKGMEWNKHKFGLDADTRFIKWINPNDMNIGSYGKYGKMAEAAAKQKYGAAAPKPQGKLAPVYNKQQVMDSRDSARRNMAQPWGRPVVSKEARDSQKRQREASNHQAMQEALKQATPAKQKISAARAAEEQRMAQQKWNNSPIGRASNFVGQTTKNVGNAADRFYRESGIKGHVDNITNAITGNRDRASAESLRRTADFQADPNAPFHAQGDQYTPENLQKEADEYQKAADKALIPSVQRVAGNVGNAISGAANAAGNWAKGAAEKAADVALWPATREDVANTMANIGNTVTGTVQNAGQAVGNFVDQNITGDSARRSADMYNRTAQNPNIDSVQRVMNQRAADNAQAQADATLLGRVNNAVNAIGNWAGEAAQNTGNAVGGAANKAAEGAKGAINSAGQWVSNAAGNVKNAASKAASDASKGASGFLNSAGKWVSNAAGNVKNAAQNAGEAVSNAAQSVGDTVGQAAEQARGGIGGVFDRARNAVGNAAQSVGDWAGNAVQDVGNAVGNAAQSVGQAAQNVGNWVGDRAQDVGNFVTGNQARQNLDDAQNSFIIGRQGRVNAAQDAYDQTLPGMVGNVAGQVGDWARNAAGNVGNTVSGAAQSVGNTVGQAAEQARGGIGGFFDKIGNTVGNAAQSVGDWAGNAANDVRNTVGGAANAVGDWAGNAAQNAGQWIGDRARDVGGAVSNAAQNAGGAVQNAVTGAANSVGQYVNANAPVVRDVVGGAVQNAGQWIGDRAQDVGNFVTGNQARQNLDDAQNSFIFGRQGRVNAAQDAYNQTLPGMVGQAGQWIGDRARDVGGAVPNVVGNVADWTHNAASNVGNAVGGAAGNVADWARNAAGNVGNMAGQVGQRIGVAAGNVGNFVNQGLEPFRETIYQLGIGNQAPQSAYYGNPANVPFYQRFFQHSAIDEKPDGVSDAFWEKFTADGGTREEYERDWR